MSGDGLVSVYSARLAGEAEVMRLMLESEGIAACVANKRFAGLFGLLNFHVLVKCADEERARARLGDQSATAGQELAIGNRDAAPDEAEEADAEGTETPAILSLFGSVLHVRSAGPAWLQWFVRSRAGQKAEENTSDEERGETR
jgi:hypothetical protein